ncbi:MAG: PAS-domain containing protein [Pseudomonadota bacterium]
MGITELATVSTVALISAVCAAWWIGPRTPRAQRSAETAIDAQAGVALLFEEETLQHASDTAVKLYQLLPGRDDWTAVRARFLNRFPGLPEHAGRTAIGQTLVPARDIEDCASLSVTRTGAYTRICMRDGTRQPLAQTERMKELQRELEDLRRASDTTSHAIWQIDAEGHVAWHNAAYAKLYERLHDSTPDPTKPIFDALAQLENDKETQRVSTKRRDDTQTDWYDISTVSVGDMTIHHAVDVNAIVKSEVAQRNFVQTLAKTFAQLSIGLAIFDRNGQLALFNPALIDLTELPAEFLSGRPTLLSFFDRMRENRRMPEPKNYNSWRQQIAEVIAAATDGRYQETWTLETGQTYRVKGRPHPDGAIAFLIEDISAEISLTRNFRAELELGQSLMDSFDEALAVFSSNGVLTFCNRAYRDLWDVDPDNSFADVTIHDCVRVWAEKCEPHQRWTEIAEFVLDYGETLSWNVCATMRTGEGLSCAVSRIASGATILRFKAESVAVIPLAKNGARAGKT